MRSPRLKWPVVAAKRPAAYQEGATGHVLPESQREIRVGSTPHRGNYRARDPANSSTLHNALVPIGIGPHAFGGIVGHVREKDRPMLSTSFAAGRADELADEIDVHRALFLAKLLDQHGEIYFCSRFRARLEIADQIKFVSTGCPDGRPSTRTSTRQKSPLFPNRP